MVPTPGMTPAPDTEAGLVRELAGKRVAKPDVQGADAHRSRRGEGAEVGDGISFRDFLDVLDPRLHGEHLAQLQPGFSVSVERMDPVEAHGRMPAAAQALGLEKLRDHDSADALASVQSRTNLFPYRYSSGNADRWVVSPILRRSGAL